MAGEGFERRDRLAFAVVGAVSGRLDGMLRDGPGLRSNWPVLIVVALVLIVALRRRFRAP
jgi:hypothetical protein